ncbi:YlbG family protein [Globicatella sanguinis]|uniref:YlbG family protein n=1 Tax=Globicatella sanguinis TaxID=13076 RepID=UPI000825344E|nr:YlbG family protein [Globicatella sanguinis]
MEFELIERQALVVWLYTLKQIKNIRKFGHVHFISNRLRYVILYVNRDEQDEIIEKLNKLHFVQKVEVSYRDDIDMTWKDAIPYRKDKDMLQEKTVVKEEEDIVTGDVNYDSFLKSLRDSLLNKDESQ